jgi:hypothetical protein
MPTLGKKGGYIVLIVANRTLLRPDDACRAFGIALSQPLVCTVRVNSMRAIQLSLEV